MATEFSYRGQFFPPDSSSAQNDENNSAPLDNTALMSTDYYEENYNMNHQKRGSALIFVHENFKSEKIQKRLNATKDCEDLQKSLKQLDFDVSIYKDYTFNQIKEKIHWTAEQDHTNSDCILVAIMSHGDRGVIHAYDVPYTLDIILNYFTGQKCPTLAGKPKIFFIQSCRGDLLDAGIRMRTDNIPTSSNSTVNRQNETILKKDININSYKIPVNADFLIAYSTKDGYLSWKNNKQGSYFIQSLCLELDANGRHYDILTLLTLVAQKIAINFESYCIDDKEKHHKKQIPCIQSMLTRLLYFPEKN